MDQTKPTEPTEFSAPGERIAFSDAEINAHFSFAGGSGTSTLDRLTPEERQALHEWSAMQQGDAARGGVIDLMAWPGWSTALLRLNGSGNSSLPPADASTFNVMDAKNAPNGVDFLVRILPHAAGVELDEKQTADLRGLIEALPAGATLASLIHSIKEHDAGRLGLNVQQYEALAPLFEALLAHMGQK